jgi:predicted nucleic acid-binding protein
MKNGLVISDSGPIFSLAIVDKLDLLNEMFEKVSIPIAVWEEITKDSSVSFFSQIHSFFKNKTIVISGLTI